MAIYVSGHEAVCSGADARILTWSGVFQPFAIGNLSANHIRMNDVPVFPGCHAPLCFCEVALRARRNIPLVRDPGIKPGYDIDAHGKSASRIIRAPASHTVARAGLFPAVTAVIHRDLYVDASCPLNDFPPNRRPWPSWVPLWCGEVAANHPVRALKAR